MSSIDVQLLYAASLGEEDKVRSLLLQGANIEAVDEYGNTALHFASGNGHDKVVKLLLDEGAKVNAVNKDDGWTPLHYASWKGHDKVAKLLIDGGAEVNAVSNDGRTPLHWASRDGYDKVVKLLLDEGAEVNAVDNWGNTPLHNASSNGRDKVVKLLLDEGAEVNAVDNNGRTPLHYASNNGHDKVVKLLIDEGAEVNAVDNNGSTPLHDASRNGYDKVVKLLLDEGAKVNAVNNNDWTPLHLASEYGNDKVVKLLLDGGAEVNAVDKWGNTPLHLASLNGRDKVVKLLIDEGADMNAVDKDGNTPANSQKKQAVVKLLEDVQAGRIVPAGHVKRAADEAKARAEAEAKRPIDQLLLDAARDGKEDKVRSLLRRGANIEAVDNEGWTALHYASAWGRDKVVKLLIDEGAKVNAVNNNVWTPLHYASRHGYDKVVKLLLDEGAEVNAVDSIGSTPLHSASYYGYDKVAKLLIDEGADMNAVDKDGNTPLDLAKSENKQAVVKLLESLHSTDHAVENLDEETAHASKGGRLLEDEILQLLYEEETERGELTFFEAVGEESSSGSTALHEWKVLKHNDKGKTYYYNMDLVKLVGIDADSLETVRGSIFAIKAVERPAILRLNRLLRLQHDLEESRRSNKGAVVIKNTEVYDKARDSVLDYITALLQKSSYESHTILDAIVLPDDTPCPPLDFFYGNSGSINLSTTASSLNGVVACVEVSSGTSSAASSKYGGGILMTHHEIHAMHLGAPFTVGGMATAYAAGAAAGSTPGVNVAAPLAMASSSMAAAGSASGGSASGGSASGGSASGGSASGGSASGSTRFGSTSTAGGVTPGGLDTAGGPPGGQGQGFSLFEKSKKFLRFPKIRNRTDDPWFAVRVYSRHVEETFNTLTELVANLNIGADIAGAANIGAEAEARRTAVIERVSREVLTAAQRATTHGIPPKHDHSITHKPPHYYCLCTRDVATLPHTVAVWSKLELHENIGTDVYIVSLSHPAAAEPLFGRAVYDESSIMQVVLNLAFGNQLRGLIGDRATAV